MKVNALRLITGQTTGFTLSSSQLLRIHKETITLRSFDCSVEDLTRLEDVMSILVHYNLLFPETASFGNTEHAVIPDLYNMDTDSSTVVRTLTRGGVFSRHTLNIWSHRTRLLQVSATLERLCFAKPGEEADNSLLLSDITVDSVVKYENRR